jgi:hypothetical protein
VFLLYHCVYYCLILKLSFLLLHTSKYFIDMIFKTNSQQSWQNVLIYMGQFANSNKMLNLCLNILARIFSGFSTCGPWVCRALYIYMCVCARARVSDGFSLPTPQISLFGASCILILSTYLFGPIYQFYLAQFHNPQSDKGQKIENILCHPYYEFSNSEFSFFVANIIHVMPSFINFEANLVAHTLLYWTIIGLIFINLSLFSFLLNNYWLMKCIKFGKKKRMQHLVVWESWSCPHIASTLARPLLPPLWHTNLHVVYVSHRYSSLASFFCSFPRSASSSFPVSARIPVPARPSSLSEYIPSLNPYFPLFHVLLVREVIKHNCKSHFYK